MSFSKPFLTERQIPQVLHLFPLKIHASTSPQPCMLTVRRYSCSCNSRVHPQGLRREGWRKGGTERMDIVG